MIPVNLSVLGNIGPGNLPAVIQSDENVIGSSSPAEIAGFAIAVTVAYVIGLFAAYYMKRKFSHVVKKDHLDFWIRCLRILLIGGAAVFTVPPLFDIGLIIVIWIVIGFIAIFAVAGQKVIGNVVAAVAIMYERPFSSGDYIMTGDAAGFVVSIGLLAVTIRTTQGVLIHIPNDQVYSTHVSNYHGNVARRFEYDINIRYQDDADRAIAVIRGIIEQYAFALHNPAPEVFVSNLAESSVIIRARVWFPSAWVNTQDDISLKTAILPQVKTALAAEGIEIPFPQRTLWFAGRE